MSGMATCAPLHTACLGLCCPFSIIWVWDIAGLMGHALVWQAAGRCNLQGSAG